MLSKIRHYFSKTQLTVPKNLHDKMVQKKPKIGYQKFLLKTQPPFLDCVDPGIGPRLLHLNIIRDAILLTKL